MVTKGLVWKMQDYIDRCKKVVHKLIKKVEGNLFLISLISLLWFLFRTARKPSRIAYPCQQAALAQFSSYFLSFFPLACLRRLSHPFKKEHLNRYAVARFLGLLLLSFLVVSTGSMIYDQMNDYKDDQKLGEHVKHPPHGAGSTGSSSLFYMTADAAQVPEHKVVSVYDPDATNWDYTHGYHWEYVNQEVVNSMVAKGVLALTGETNTVDAWKALIPYQPGENVALKLNFNNSWDCNETDNDIDPIPETVNAIIDGLASIGVPEDNIWIFDASRIIPDRFIDGIDHSGVRFYSAISWHTCKGNYHHTSYVDANSPETSRLTCTQGNLPQDVIRPAQVLVDADHLINIPILKSHGPYVTLALKNHYGSVEYALNDRGSMHAYFEAGGNSANCPLETSHVLADISNNPNIRDKTRLIIGDGLYGNAYENWKGTRRWRIFDDDDPNILFFSTDPIAASSVMTDYIMEERGWQDHYMLHAGAHLGLGIHEHWDSFQNKEYTAIDYVEIDLNDEIIAGDVTGDGLVDMQDVRACVSHILGMRDWGMAADVNGDGAVDVLDVQRIIDILS